MAAGLIAVVAVRPDTLQPVGTFVSDMFVQEADADDGDSTITPSTKDKQAKPGKDSKANSQGGCQGRRQGGRQGRREAEAEEQPARVIFTRGPRQEVTGIPSHHQMSRTGSAGSVRGVP